MEKNKERLDVLIVKKGLLKSREKAKSSIKAGLVFVNNEKIDKSSVKVSIDSDIQIKGEIIPYVSRGGLKLEKAIEQFDLELTDKTGLDIGASTGGFTDCMLQNGVSKVYAVDVGKEQLDKKLKEDDRVIVMEKTNVRYMDENDLGEKVDFVTIDVSFISLKFILPVARKLATDNVDIVALIKPQFEAGKDKLGKKGIVKDKRIHIEVIENVLKYCRNNKLDIVALTYSPIKGGSGNIEYLAHIKNKSVENICTDISQYIKTIVDKSHAI
ncbi:TlyA family RNA methyltransferase [Clostridiaceae bacterium M8S5]|nr:TlyA family RNA methyltransferase [Clostridiaceae bacterium M8S5]